MPEFETITIPELPDLTLAITSFLEGASPNGFSGKFTMSELTAFLAPYLSSIGSSGYLQTTGNTLPTLAVPGNYYTLTSDGTFSGQTATSELNLWSYVSGAWVLTVGISLGKPEIYKTISGTTLPNKLQHMNTTLLGVGSTSGVLQLLPNETVSNYPDSLAYTPSSGGNQQFYTNALGTINYSKKSSVGFWVNTALIESGGINFGLTFYGISMNDLGSPQTINISKGEMQTINFQRTTGQLNISTKAVNGSFSFIKIVITPLSSIGVAVYYGHNFFVLGAVAGKKYVFGGFVEINEDFDVLPYAIYEGLTSSSSDSFWEGKRVTWCGDSIFAEDQSQQVVIDTLGIISTNLAVAGSTITPGYGSNPGGGVSTLERVALINASNPDLIYLNGGTNDFGYEVPLGTIFDPGHTTFYGAYKELIYSLVANNPNIPILVSTPLYGNNGTVEGPGGTTSDVDVFNGRKLFANAIKEICEMYSVPVLDKFQDSGIGIYNYTVRLRDTIHPTPKTYEMLGRMDTEFIKRH